MAVLRSDIERALDEIVSQEEGMRFQGLAVVLAKMRWPELIANHRKKDFGLDAWAPPSETKDGIGKGLAASITPTLKKISDDAANAKKHYHGLGRLLFVTPRKVGNADVRRWAETVAKDHEVELLIIGREEIITLLMMPENASLCTSHLRLNIEVPPGVAELIARTRRAAAALTEGWAARLKGRPLINLSAVSLDKEGAETDEIWELESIDDVLCQGGRVILEGPAGRGKTTTLVQLAQRGRTVGIPLIVELPAWSSSGRSILDFVAGMLAFMAEGLTAADLARVERVEPLLFLLNGWNEVAGSDAAQASNALRELDRDFLGAGIIVATRTYHVTPPLRDALRLRLLPLRRAQRKDYLTERLSSGQSALSARIETDPSLDELTRTPFILAEVVSLFEAGVEIPSTQVGIIAHVLHLQEQHAEHRNALQVAPLYDRQADYLSALATEMTWRGSAALSEPDARSIASTVTTELSGRGQVGPAEAPAVLATLVAHHALERVEYPHAAFRFAHQKIQEFYAARALQEKLIGLSTQGADARAQFAAEYVNSPLWSEPLCLLAEALVEGVDDDGVRSTSAAGSLVMMALAIDPVFAGELAQRCGPVVWEEVGPAVGEHLRALYTTHDGIYGRYALTAMLATGSSDFGDILFPLLSAEDQETRLRTYQLWPRLRLSILGTDWQDRVRGWSEEARADFVSELLRHRLDGEIASFASEDSSAVVKREAAQGLMWAGSDDALITVLESMDEQTFEEVVGQNAEEVPPALRPRSIGLMRRLLENTSDEAVRLGTAARLVALGEPGLETVVKETLEALTKGKVVDLRGVSIEAALRYLRVSDPSWVSDWVARQVADGVLYEARQWLSFVTALPEGLGEECIERLTSEELSGRGADGCIAVVAAFADTALAARVFTEVRDLSGRRGTESPLNAEHRAKILCQLEDTFRALPHDIAAAGLLLAATPGDPVDIEVAAELLSRVGRSDPLQIADESLRARLRSYLKGGVPVVLHQDDFWGAEKAALASSLAQVGKPEDMADLVRLIRADIDRVRRGRAARAAGDRGPQGNGGSSSHANWHLAALVQLDGVGAAEVLTQLISAPEYRSQAAAAMARDFLPKPERPFERVLRFELIWAAREGSGAPAPEDQRRVQFAAALNAEMRRLREKIEDQAAPAGLKDLARALAAIDPHGSAAAVVNEVATPGPWEHSKCLEAAERLLMAGTVLPATAAFALVDSLMARTRDWMQDSDRHLLCRILTLLPFVDDANAGVAKIREVLSKRRLGDADLREILPALGESRLDAAVDLLYDLAPKVGTWEGGQGSLLHALARLDTDRARDLFLGFIDPDIAGVWPTEQLQRADVVVSRLVELAQQAPETAERLRRLCERELPEPNRQMLSKVMRGLRTSEAFSANLNLIDDASPSAVREGLWRQLEDVFLEELPYGSSPNVFVRSPRVTNELRSELFSIALNDRKRQKAASRLLAQIEEWRLEYGRPLGEPRHPEITSGRLWPSLEPCSFSEERWLP